MLNFLPSPIVGVISFLMYVINTLFWVIPIFIFTIFKFIPIHAWRTFVSKILDASASAWVSCNSLIQNLMTRVKWDVKGAESLSLKDWYLVVSNHQSWVDILILQRVFNKKVPFLKFFLKKQLAYVPVLGAAWWALDFPFMQRYSKQFLAKHPELKGKDIETTKKSCEKFKYKPVSVMNFVEGTRFTAEKHKRTNGNFTHLLNPKAGGIAFVLSAMGDHLNKLLDVTIYYPKGIPTFWDFISGKVNDITVRIQVKDIQQHLVGDYVNDVEFQAHFQQWVNQMWLDKDQQMKQLSAVKDVI